MSEVALAAGSLVAAVIASHGRRGEKQDRLIKIHYGEQEKIERQLSKLAPKSLLDISCLLEFVIELDEKGCMAANADIDMLRNARAASDNLARRKGQGCQGSRRRRQEETARQFPLDTRMHPKNR
jgi:hypothetical protein